MDIILISVLTARAKNIQTLMSLIATENSSSNDEQIADYHIVIADIQNASESELQNTISVAKKLAGFMDAQKITENITDIVKDVDANAITDDTTKIITDEKLIKLNIKFLTSNGFHIDVNENLTIGQIKLQIFNLSKMTPNKLAKILRKEVRVFTSQDKNVLYWKNKQFNGKKFKSPMDVTKTLNFYGITHKANLLLIPRGIMCSQKDFDICIN